MGRPCKDREIIDTCHELYLRGYDLSQVAFLVGYRSGTTVLGHFQRHGLITRSRGGAIKESQKGPDNGNWKGGVIIHEGYVYFWIPEHHRANALGYVGGHVLAAEQKLGRALLPSEIPHHINRIRSDNRPENIEVFKDHSQHASHHREEKKRERSASPD